MKTLRAYLAAFGFIATVFIGTLAVSQTFTRSIQQSQDLTGAFLVDSNQGIYLPGHILSPTTNTTRPVPTVTGTGTPTVSGTDTAGLITMGTSGNTAVLTFGQPFLSVPSCVVTWQSNLTTMTYTVLTGSLNIGQTATSGNKINYFCPSAS